MLASSLGLSGTCQISLLKSYIFFFSNLYQLDKVTKFSAQSRRRELNSTSWGQEYLHIKNNFSVIYFFHMDSRTIYFVLWNLIQHYLLVCVVAQFVKIFWFNLCLSL